MKFKRVFLFPACIAAIVSAALSPVIAAPGEESLNLIPKPSRILAQEGILRIDAGFRITITGEHTPLLTQSAVRFLNRLEKRTGLYLNGDSARKDGKAILEIHCAGKETPVQSVTEDESYLLEIFSDRARLSASSPIGILRGLETFLQLIDIDAYSFFVPALEVEDHPRFRWRGLLIDVARHFEPVEVIKQNLEAMAAVKMNVLHWHLSDDQGFRVESKIFPKLHQLGSNGEYYSQSDIREIVAFARSLGIRIVPEFDIPGHSTSWLVAYPELAAAPGPYEIERHWGVFEPCMDPSREDLYRFLDRFVGEMAGLFPDEYFHIGGDEVKATQWNSNPGIRGFKARHNLAGNHDLQVYFNKRLLEILAKHGKKMIGWDEILHPDLPRSVIVQSWRGQAFLANGARQGFSGILSSGYYLDHMRPASFHYAVDPLGNEAAGLSDEEKTRILGGEACMWAEFVNSENIESRIWPRTAAIAERLWSPAEVNDTADLYRRLEFIDRELQALGLEHHILYLEKMHRLAGKADVDPLLVFADLLKPPSLSVRKQSRTYTSDTPLNRLVDALMPESGTARKFGELVDSLQKFPNETPETLGSIRGNLTAWLRNYAPLKSIIAGSFLLQETAPLAETVAELCRRGIEAEDFIRSHRKPPDDWVRETTDLLDRAEKPQAETFIAILPPIRNLIQAASDQP